MKFRSESRLSQPRDKVFAAYRDRLPEIVPFLEDISSITVVSRSAEGGSVKLHNEWRSGKEIPSVAQAFIKPEHLVWDDHATWDEAGKRCTFTIKTRLFTENVKCTGTNTFVEDGAGTKIILEGDFEVSLKNIPGVPWLLASTIAPQVEKFIIALIQPNLTKVNEALGRFLDKEG